MSRLSKHSIYSLITALTLTSPSWAFAQENLAAQEKTVAGGDLMLISYLALWLLIFGFVFTVFRAQRGLQADLEQLQRRIDTLPTHEPQDLD